MTDYDFATGARNLQELAEYLSSINREKGFHDRFKGVERSSQAGVDAVTTSLMLAVGELIEAQNELRDGHRIDQVYYKPMSNGTIKPEGFGIELADAVIRILDLTALLGINIGDLVRMKAEFNLSRPRMHDKSF
jgi:hypothetical protein